MNQNIDRVLKSDDVEIDGRLLLDLEHPAASGQTGRGAIPATAAAKVRMLENQREFAVMEVTCACGRKTIIRCDYGEKTCEQK